MYRSYKILKDCSKYIDKFLLPNVYYLTESEIDEIDGPLTKKNIFTAQGSRS